MDAADATRSKGLDGLRGVAVLQVVFYHYYLLWPIQPGGFDLVLRLGNAIDGVTLFFVLSGYLIGGNLLEVRDAPALFRVFYGRRACRILPLYAVLLASYVFIQLVDARMRLGFIYYWHSGIPFWHYLVFWQNNSFSTWGSLGAPWLVVTWSLAVEQQFYATIPWIIRYVTDRRLLVTLCLGGMLSAGLKSQAAPNIAYLLIDRIDALASGVLLALIVRSAGGRKISGSIRQALRLLLGIYATALIALRAAGQSNAVVDNPLTASVMYALMIRLLVDEAPWWPIRPVLGLLAPIGLWSYFIYLFHLPVAYVLKVLLPIASLAALPVTIMFAALSYRYFEEPIVRWGHRLKYRPTASAGPDPARA